MYIYIYIYIEVDSPKGRVICGQPRVQDLGFRGQGSEI